MGNRLVRRCLIWRFRGGGSFVALVYFVPRFFAALLVTKFPVSTRQSISRKCLIDLSIDRGSSLDYCQLAGRRVKLAKE